MKFCLGIVNMDTESAKEGRMSSFCASPFVSRLVFIPPEISKNWCEDRKLLETAKLEVIRKTPLTEIRTTSQDEVREWFRVMEQCAQDAEKQIKNMNPKLKKLSVYYVCLFANAVWDLNVIKGIVFPEGTEFNAIGNESDMVELQAGHIRFRDFFRLTGFSSIRSAGLCCLSAKKENGESTYNITDEDIPNDWNDYSEEQKSYMINDVLVMNEALNIILNRKENYSIQLLSELPLTATGFMRWRMMNNEDIICYDGIRHDVSTIINLARWRVMRRNLGYLMRGYKGGYCGPNPHVQFMTLHNVRCYDARSMYPHKMLFFKMLQCVKGQETVQVKIKEDHNIRSAILSVIEYAKSTRAFDENWIFREKLEDTLPAFQATLDLKLEARVLCPGGARMMPFLSVHKLEGIKLEGGKYNKNVVRSNGKVISADRVRVILSSVDLFLCCLCYNVTLLNCTEFLSMQWLPMLYVQKRPVVADYKTKDLFSQIMKMNRFNEEVKAYWEDVAGIPYEAVLRMTDGEYKDFCKEYKRITKSSVNGQYGLTIQKPLNDDIIVIQDEENIYHYKTVKTVEEKRDELIQDPEKAKGWVQVSDYCAGCSITMWARWQLVTLMYAFYRNGIETYYCDTDSLFVHKSEKADSIVNLYNQRLQSLYDRSEISKDEVITPQELDDIGNFEVDKDCEIWRTLGAKNYGYISGDKIILTIAGLRTNNYIDHIKEAKVKENISLKDAFKKYYRPNVAVSPEVARKLIMDTKNCKYDSDGNWIGPVLVPCGFEMVSFDSTFHLHNAKIASEMQGKAETWWQGYYNDRLYLEESGFTTDPPPGLKKRMYQQLNLIVSDRSPMKGGQKYGKKRVQPNP